MPTLESLRRQIDTATDLDSVVKTMKTLAAVSIHQYEQAVESLGDYNRTIELGFQIALKRGSFALDYEDSPRRTAAIVFGSNQGMCGQFNEEIVSLVNERSSSNDAAASTWLLLAVGTRVDGQLLDSGWAIEQVYDIPSSVSDITDLVQSVLPKVEQLREEQGIDRLLVFFNRRNSASSFESKELQLLPMEPQRWRRWCEERWNSNCLPVLSIAPHRLVSRLMRQYLFVSLFTACAESLASENASRIAAMQAAEKNIEQRLEELRGTFNRVRQSAITEEILDVVSGFEALSNERKNLPKTRTSNRPQE